MKNLLFIGGTGFIGNHIINLFELKGYKIVQLIRVDNEMPFLNPNPNIKVYYGSIADYNIIETILVKEQIQIVFHLASKLIPSSNFNEFLQEFEIITYNTIKILPLLSSLNIKLVYFSSGGAIYGGNYYQKIKETDQLSPLSYYGMSKLYLEEAIKLEHRKSNLNYLILRPSNPYGVGQKINSHQGLISNCLNKILRNEEISIWGDGSAVRDYIYIDDLSNMVLNIIEKSEGSQIYNLGSGVGSSVLDVLDVLKLVTKLEFKVVFKEKRNVDAQNIVLDIEKSKQFASFNYTSLKDGIDLFYNKIIEVYS